MPSTDLPFPALLALGSLALVLAIGIWVWITYNRLVHLRELLTQSRRGVDVELARRHTLIPELVTVVSTHAAHERRLLELLAEDPAQGVLHPPLAATAERYPALAASGSFQKFAHQLAQTEDRLAAARRIHAANERSWASTVESFPANLVARAGSFAA